MNKTTQLALLSAASLTLSGCNSPLLARLGLVPKRAPVVEQTAAVEAEPRVDAALALDEGRAQLRAGQIAAAVASFRVARLDPAFAAEADNGLGVAYAKLGRADLASDYFRAAIARAPGEMRFAANYLRLQREIELARAAASRPAPALAQARPASARVAAAPVHRISDGEVRIVTAPVSVAAPRMAIAYAETAPVVPAAATAAAEPTQEPAPAADAPRDKVIVIQP